jgi:beta-phosphoglucomutase
MNHPKAILFDFDGVVVDSFDAHYGAWKSAFKELFNKNISLFPHQTHAGKSPMLIAEYFCEQINKTEQTNDLFLLKGTHLHKGLLPPNLLPGVHEITEYLLINQTPYGIASNATKKFIKNSINQLSLVFDTFMGVEDYKFPKPHPEAYISLAKKLNISTQDFNNTWVFEDSITGTEAAKSAGMIPIGILTQYTEQELINAGSQLVFPTLLEAFQFLKTLR